MRWARGPRTRGTGASRCCWAWSRRARRRMRPGCGSRGCARATCANSDPGRPRRPSGYTFAMTQLFRDVAGKAICRPQGSVVCIGAFDGLHRGHQALVGRAAARARDLGLPLVALTFEPLPREYFAPDAPPARLSLPRAKFEGLRDLGADIVGLLRFDARLATMEAEQFIRALLVERLSAREVWAGPDFRYGKGRHGDWAMLASEGARLGFSAHSIEPVLVDGERVSSSRLRLQLAAGDLDAAARALGRRYSLSGRVVYGKQLGRKL